MFALLTAEPLSLLHRLERQSEVVRVHRQEAERIREAVHQPKGGGGDEGMVGQFAKKSASAAGTEIPDHSATVFTAAIRSPSVR
jgi:hypothetical protein